MKTAEELHSVVQGGPVKIVQPSYCLGRSKWVLSLTNWLIYLGYELMMCSFVLVCYTPSQKAHTLQGYH